MLFLDSGRSVRLNNATSPDPNSISLSTLSSRRGGYSTLGPRTGTEGALCWRRGMPLNVSPLTTGARGCGAAPGQCGGAWRDCARARRPPLPTSSGRRRQSSQREAGRRRVGPLGAGGQRAGRRREHRAGQAQRGVPPARPAHSRTRRESGGSVGWCPRPSGRAPA